MDTQAAIDVLPSSDALMHAAAERFVSCAVTAIGNHGRFVVALAGGSTPKKLYAGLANAAHAQRIDWGHVHVFWGDERCVPADDPQSNYHMTREALLDHVPLPAANIHRIHGEDPPAAAASAYERELRSIFATPAGAPRPVAGGRFDLILLGMGDNGHTASLFPGLTAVHETQRWVAAEYVGEVSMWRVTLTPVVINAAAEVVFLVSGSDKAAMLQRVLEGPYQPGTLPAQVVAPSDGQLRWLVDTAAAARLKRRRE